MQIATDEGYDPYRDEEPPKRSCCQEVVEMMGFQMCIGVVIAANAVVIGMETDAPGLRLWQELEDVFLSIFLLELLMKLMVYGGDFFRYSNPDLSWNVFDFTIVTLGATDRICSHMASDEKGHDTSFFVLLMRTFRLLRLLRIIRIFRLMKQLYLLANSMLDAFSAVFWVSVLCSMILYVCSILLTRLVGRPGTEGDPALNEFRVEHFGSVKVSMLTLFRLMALPDMEKFKPVYEVMPALELFLVSFIIFGAFAIASVLTGVITETLLGAGRKREDERRFDRERSRSLLAQDLRTVFQDASGSGILDRGQYEKCREKALRICSLHSMRLRPQDLDALFELVDDGSGHIDAEELLYGMVQLNSEVRPMAVMELRRLVVRGIHGISEQMAAMDARMQMMDRRMIELQAASRYGAMAPPAAREAGGAPSAPASPAPTAAPAVDLLGTPVM